MLTTEPNRSSGRGVSLIDLLSLFAGVSGCSGAVLAGKNTGSTILSWIAGLVIGLGCSSVVWKFGRRAIYRLKLHEATSSPFQLILSWILLFVAIAWVVASAFIAFWLTKLITR
jgi:hypothetical protein